MDEEDRYSIEAKIAYDFFVSENATHIFYVEDSAAEIFYERLFGRLFPGLESYDVVCLHGKSNIIKKSHGAQIQDLKYIFVVDKDFDDLFGAPTPRLTYFDRYSIENYLCDIESLVEVLVEQCPTGKTAKSIKLELADYKSFRQELDSKLVDITRYFVVVQRFHLEMTSTKTGFSEIMKGSDDSRPIPTSEWIDDYRKKVIENSGLLEADLDIELGKALDPSPDFPNATTTDIHHVPGKHILPSILKYFGARMLVNLEKSLGKSLYIRILNHVPVSQFDVFKTRLISQHPELGDFQ